MRKTFRTETEISGARFHRAGHVKNVPHVQKTTVISAPVLKDRSRQEAGAVRVGKGAGFRGRILLPN